MKIGELVANRYEIEDVLGVGGMSTVFRARDHVLGRRVALKVLHEHYSDDPEYVERFRREARAIARLSHPNIVTVIDRGEFEGRQFIVFEYVDGENLKELLGHQGPLPVVQALALTHQAARGLAFAHENGVVHRDVKPQNVLVDPDGAAKVTDFGIARSADAGEGLTMAGTVLGTGDYISPEQAAGEPADERTDQYSLGALLYELLTGEVPYPADGTLAAAMRHLHDPVPRVRDKRPDVSPRVDALIRRAMAKRPEDRYPSTDALIAALETCLTDARAGAAHEDGDGEVTRVITPVAPLPPRPAPAAEPREPRRPPRKPRVGGGLARFLAAVSVLLGGAAALAYFVNEAQQEGSGGARAIRLVALQDYDPIAGDGEHPELVAEATDRDPATYWRTETYGSFDKDGVGIIVDAGRRRELEAIIVQTDTPGFEAEIQAGNSPDGPFEPVSESQEVARRTTFELDGGRHRYYVVWITDLDEVAHVNEVRAR